MSDLEGTVTHLGEDVAASHKRIEDMMQKILQNQGQKQGNTGEDTTEPLSSAQMLDTSSLTSTMVEATTLVHQPVPAPLLTTMSVADTPLPSVVHVPNDVAEDVVTNVTMNNQGVHTSPGTVIAAVVKDILREGNKSTDSHATGDPAEPEPEEDPMQAMEDIDEGHPETKGILDAPEQNTILEQVTSPETHECNSFMK